MIRKSVAEILEQHVTFELEAFDRMYLNAWKDDRISATALDGVQTAKTNPIRVNERDPERSVY